MKSFAHFVTGVLLIWTLATGLTFVAALWGLMVAQVHLVDVMALSFVVPIAGSIMFTTVRRWVMFLGESVSPIGVVTDPFNPRR